jgi:Bacterial extracellular solute-binding proteins, family 5 Middle
MKSNFEPINQFLQAFSDMTYRIRKIWNVVWPINWSNLQKYELVLETMDNTTRLVKGLLIACVVGILFSFFFLASGIYLVLTVDTAKEGGEFSEAIYGANFEKLNPTLNNSNDTEKKLIDLIYQPLYRIKYPDFLNKPSDQPRIEPVLLSKEPEIAESESGKFLRLELRPDLKWSDGSELDSNDVAYTFDRLKEPNGNSEFKDLLSNYNIIPTSKTTLEIKPIQGSKSFNNQLKYLIGFYPISRKYFEEKKLDEIASSPKSTQNELTSGYYTIPKKVLIAGKEAENPIKDQATGLKTIVLEKNSQNKYRPPFITKYVVKVYSDLVDLAGLQNNSVERAAFNKKVDLFTRVLSPNSQVAPDYISSKFGLNQKIIPTNTYYIVYSNMQSGQWLINQALRKYVLCSFEGFTLEKNRTALEVIEPKKQFVSPQLGNEFDPNCNGSKQELIDQKSKLGKPVYNVTDEGVMLDGKVANLNILTLDELGEMTTVVQSKLEKRGIKSFVTTAKDQDDLDRKISDKAYNLVLLPTTVISRDLYPMYGAKSRNISTINKNNRVGREEDKFGEGIEKLMKDYSDGNLQSQEIKSRLTEFFSTEFVSVNLFRSRQEINYSKRVYLEDNSFDGTLTFVVDIYNNLPMWYSETSRKFRWK